MNNPARYPLAWRLAASAGSMFTDTEYDEALLPVFDALATRSPTGPILDQSALDQSALDQSALDQSALDQSAVGQSALDQSALGQSALGQYALDQSALAQSALDQSARAQLPVENDTLWISWFASCSLVTNGAVGSALKRNWVVSPPFPGDTIAPPTWSISSALMLNRANAAAAVHVGQYA